MIAFKDNYNLWNEEYSVHVLRKEAINRIAYYRADSRAIVHLKNGTYLEIDDMNYTTFLSLLKQLDVSLADL